MNENAQTKKTALPILIWLAFIGIGFGSWIALLLGGGDAPRAWRALLINFMYFTPLSAGMVVWSAIVIASNGHWAKQAEKLSWTGIGFFPPALLILVALWIGSPQWAPWYHKGTPQGVWLDNTFLFIRDIAALLILWGVAAWYLARRRKGRDRAMLPAPILILTYCLVFTLLAFDLVMALDPHWHSTAFGAYFFMSGLYIAVVFWGLLAVLQRGMRVNERHDLGNLMLAFCILTTYFLYIQLLTIWYENLPSETSYVARRMNLEGWRNVGIALLILIYLGPILLLLTKWAKRTRWFLGGTAFLLLSGLWIERWWLIAPQFTQHVEFGWVEIASAAGVLGALGVSIGWTQKRLPPGPAEERKSR